MKILAFFKSKRVWLNLAAMVLVAVILVLGTLEALKQYTRHGKTVKVPDFTGLQMDELKQYTSDNYFDFVVIDSIYDAKEEKGSIIEQDPTRGSDVKKGRKIYLTVVAMNPEQIRMPNLNSLSLRQAKATLESYGLQIGSLEYIRKEDRNAVHGQKYLGSPIAPGEWIEKGSAITLQLGRGKGKEKIQIPFLIGLSKREAINQLYSHSLNVGKERFYNPSDTTNPRVYIQSPKPLKNRTLNMGAPVNLIYRNNRNVDYKEYIEQYKKDSLLIHTTDTLSQENDAL
ncbi:MAG: PASTA domain-containing protein [Bacteroidales bacterium]